MTNFERVKTTINQRYPEVKIHHKKDMWLFKRFNKTAGPSFSIGKHLILGRKEPDILIHELQHWIDRKNQGSLHWYYDYLSPQIYSVFWVLVGILASVFGVWAIAGACAIAAIVCLLPVESSQRIELERRAYLAGMWTDHQINGYRGDIQWYGDYVVGSMSSKLYYGMCSAERARIIVDSMIEQVEKDDHDGFLEAAAIVLASGVVDELNTIQ